MNDNNFEVYEGGVITCPTCKITMTMWEFDNHDCERDCNEDNNNEIA